jgi:hypothetical protein
LQYGLVRTGGDHLLGDLPHLYKALVKGGYLSFGGDNEDAVEGGFALGIQEHLLEAQRLLGPLTVGDIPGVDHHPTHVGVLQQGVADRFEIPPGAVRVPEPELHERDDAPAL